MRAFVVKELTHPSKIPLSTHIPEPTAGPGQVLVDVYSAGLNFFEVVYFLCASNHTFFFYIDPPSARKISNKTPSALYSWVRIRGQDISGLTHPNGVSFETRTARFWGSTGSVCR